MTKIFSFCKQYLLMHKWRLFLYVCIGIFTSLLSLVSPYIMGDFIDRLLGADDIGFIYRYFMILAVVNVLSLSFGYIRDRLYIQLQTRLGYALNRDFIQRFQRAPLLFSQNQDTAYLNQRINNDSNSLIIFSISILQNILVNTVMVIVPSVLLFAFNPGLAIILLSVAAVYFTFYTLYRKVLYRASHAYQESQSRFFAKLNEQLFSVRFIKLHSLFTHFINRLNNSFALLFSNALKYQRANYIFTGLDQLVLMVAQMTLLLFGGMEIVAGRLTVGRFIIISAYFNMMLGAIRYFFSLGQTVQSNMVSYSRLQELAAVEPEPNGSLQLEKINSIELKSVSFAYGGKSVLKDVNIRFITGRIYVILGPNGAGKSTLADIIMGLQAGNFTGQVLYNGEHMDNVDMYALRGKHMGVSEQEPTLLVDTLANNLNLDKDFMLTDKASRLVKLLGLDAYINALPDKYETIINENSVNVSGGEKQKLSIMRALIKNPSILILDEPTSALDTASKQALKSYLHEIKKDKIIIVITHDKDFADSGNNIIRI